MIRVITLLLTLAGSTTLAETVTIRSGQHDSFSRLVLAIPEGTAWSLVRSGEGYTLALGEGGDDFDLSEVFERITTERIAQVEQVGGQLRIDMACECHADAFLWRPDRLVIDIVDGPAPQGSEFELVAEVEEIPAQLPPQIQLPIVSAVRDRSATEPLISGTFSVEPSTDPRIANAETAIIESLARAASQGVFQPPERPLPFVAENLAEDGERVITQSPPILTPVTDPADGIPMSLAVPGNVPGPGLTLRTGIERSEPETSDANNDGRHCIVNDLVSLHDWGDERDYSTQISEKRRALTTEFDNYFEGAIEELARTELYFGFGREAQLALIIDGQRSRERSILNALGQIIDGERVTTGILDDQLDCEGFVVLWAALAAGEIEPASQKGRDAAVMAFRLLPDGLRGHIGADLADLFLQAGDPLTADMVLTASKQQADPLGLEAEITSAELAGALEGPQATIDALDTLAGRNVRMTIAGLARLLELQVAQGQLPETALLDLAKAMRFEARGGEDVGRLVAAEIAAHSLRDDFKTALEIISDNGVPLTDEERKIAASALHIAMAERQGDQPFLDYVFDDLSQRISAEAENALALRLLKLGFPERASELVSGPAVQEVMAERRYLRAQVAAYMSDLEAVEVALAGLGDERANEIRANALAATGEFERSLARRLASGDLPAEPENAWRAGAWTLLEDGEDPLLQDASRAVLTQPSPLAETPTLEERRILLERAQETRSLTEELLDRFSIDLDE